MKIGGDSNPSGRTVAEAGRITVTNGTAPERVARLLAADRSVERRGVIGAAAFVLASVVVNALSGGTELAREGSATSPLVPWILELSSGVATISLLPAVVAFTRRYPLTGLRWRQLLPLYLLASGIYSALHVTGMVLLRKVAYPLLLDVGYTFFVGPGAIVRESLYEYRKDVLSFALACGLFQLLRDADQRDREQEAAQREARQAQALTLKCGGTTFRLRAEDVLFARAAGNYVEVRAGGRTHLARMTLGALEEQLAEAGVTVLRTHRSWVVNAETISSVSPTGDGGATVTLTDGSEVPASRRYRSAVDTHLERQDGRD